MGSYELRLDPSSRRSLRRLPTAVMFAVVEFMAGPLLENPERVGGELERELAGYRAARVRDYRIIYRVLHEESVVRVVGIGHRRDAYRSR